jgi:uncharacterized protein DUF3467
MTERKQINFTILPDDSPDDPQALPRRVYANFCAIAHTPFDVTLSFCEVEPLSRKDLEAAGRGPEATAEIKAPVRARIVLPLQVLPNLIGALQEQLRMISESAGGTTWERGPVH